MRLLYLGLSYRITERAGLRSRESLALVGALVLSLGVLAFSGGEAWGQQLSEEEAQQQSAAAVNQQRTVVTNGETVEPVTGGPPVEEIPPVEPSLKVSPDDPATSLIVRYGPDVGSEPEQEPAPPVPEPMPEPPPVDTRPAPGVDLMPAPEPVSGLDPILPVASEPAPPVDLAPAPEPAIFEEREPLPPPVEEAPASVVHAIPLSEEEAAPPPSSLETTVSGAVETLQSAAAGALENLADGSLFQLGAEEDSLIGTGLVGLSSGGGASSTPVDERTEAPGSPSGGTEGPSRSEPQLFSPLALPPIGGGYFHLSGSGEIGPGGVQLLLLCVLVSSLVLTRRDGGLSWGFWEPPKPSSALLLPLERPG